MWRRLGFAAVVGLIAATPVLAEPVRIDVEAFYGISQSASSVSGILDPNLDYRSAAYYGGGVNVRWTSQFSTLVSAASVEPGLRLTGLSEAEDFPFVGTVRTTPLSLIVQWHPLGLGAIDPYVGAGGAWVLTSNAALFSFVYEETTIGAVVFEDRFAFVADAGARFGLVGPLGLLVDVRYMPFTSDATVELSTATPFGIPIEVQADPFLFGFGLSFRF